MSHNQAAATDKTSHSHQPVLGDSSSVCNLFRYLSRPAWSKLNKHQLYSRSLANLSFCQHHSLCFRETDSSHSRNHSQSWCCFPTLCVRACVCVRLQVTPCAWGCTCCPSFAILPGLHGKLTLEIPCFPKSTAPGGPTRFTELDWENRASHTKKRVC